jgi:hypothetical protein
MINAVSSLTTTLIDYLQQTEVTQGTSSLKGISGFSGGSAIRTANGIGFGDSADISGPAKLFSQLQQLLSEDPTKLIDLLTKISAQLQAAAEKAGSSSLEDFLTDLSSKFSEAATTGDLSSLKPDHPPHHGQGIYNQQGNVVPPSNPVPETSSVDGVDLKQLFETISTEVSQTVGV